MVLLTDRAQLMEVGPLGCISGASMSPAPCCISSCSCLTRTEGFLPPDDPAALTFSQGHGANQPQTPSSKPSRINSPFDYAVKCFGLSDKKTYLCTIYLFTLPLNSVFLATCVPSLFLVLQSKYGFNSWINVILCISVPLTG